MPKVYVLNNGGHDYSDAERFGQVVFCSDHVIRKDDTALMYRVLNEALANAEPHDYILVSSLTSLCMIAAAIMAEMFGEIHMLIYSNGRYVSRDVILGD